MASASDQEVPRWIHQTWRDREVPDQWRSFQASWLRQNSGWKYSLWTDADLRQLVRDHYPWFLTIYDNYRDPIQRVDAARYFLIHRYGGVYVDLDFECLRPLDELLKAQTLVLGLEPHGHLEKAVVRAHGLAKVVCNAFIASRPQHPFWEHVFLELVGSHDVLGPLASTGPFLLTRALESYPGPEPVTCAPSELLYPGTSMEAAEGKLRDPAWRAAAAKSAYAIHHWSGSWIDARDEQREPEDDAPESAGLSVVARGEPLLDGDWRLPSEPADDGSQPLVSCLMVTRSSRLPFVRRAIACFRGQTYPARELLIVDDSGGKELSEHVAALGDPRIRLARLPPENLPLGALRNVAVERAAGPFVMQWDDDDLFHPRRIELQMAALQAAGGDACLLSRWQIWWPERRRLATSKARGWEGSILCRRDKLPRYDDTRRRGEDTPVVLRLASRERVAFLDAPWLYTYVVHGTNTTDLRNLDDHWTQATECHWNGTYPTALRRMAGPLPAQVRAELLARLDADPPVPSRDEAPAAIAVPVRRSASPAAVAAAPRVLVLTPVKDGLPFLDTYFSLLERLEYPGDRLSLALLESDSTDGTLAALQSRPAAARGRYSRVEVFKRDFGLRLVGSRSDAAVQAQRRSVLARSRNYLLARALRDEDWVLWLDVDVVDYGPDVLARLLETEKQIVVPHCVLAPGGRTFDLNTFIATDDGLADASASTDGAAALAQPARGEGRMYLEDVRDRDLVEVDGVGGTMLLVQADLHREGLLFPAVPYRRHLETEGLALLARDLGVRCWGLPKLEIVHANR